VATSLAEHVSARLLRAGFTASSPEICQIRDHNNCVFARAAAEHERELAAEQQRPDWLIRRLTGRA